MTLRPYQTTLVADIRAAWAGGAANVLAVLPTGGGKTVVLADIVRAHVGASCVIAHRAELVSQLSLALAREGVRHRIIASTGDQRAIAAAHVAEYGRVWLDPNARCAVASVDTLIRRDNLGQWLAGVTLWVQDESHHTLSDNKWGKAASMCTHPQARGLGMTATPRRADGKGLGRTTDGLADVMVEGPTARWLMDAGYLTRYKVATANSHLEEYLGDVAASGDWSTAQLRSASQHSQIVGDVVKSYRQFADGKLGITFATDVTTATEMATAYRAGGVSAEVLTGETDSAVRRAILRRFAKREILQVVAVDVISEGFDLPACEAVTFARPTASLAVFLQQMGRGLRPAPGKEFCQVIDHVGNFLRHGGGPDTPRVWSLDRRAGAPKGVSDAIPSRICLNIECGQPYERHWDECPYCGTPAPPPASKGSPEQVEGDMSMMDDETLARIRGDMPLSAEEHLAQQLHTHQLPARWAISNNNKHKERLAVLAALREAMGVWGGGYYARGESDAEIQRRFWHTWGVDVGSALTLGREDAQKLLDRIVSAT